VNETLLLREVGQDLQSAPAQVVIYLEGKTDPPIFFALLGVAASVDSLHRGVLVRGLKDTSSGGAAVKARIQVAEKNGYAGVYGIVDGDGDSLATLTARFASPFAGPCFCWPAYCIENMLVKSGWPAGWGSPPDWRRALLGHVPYVALNRIHRELREKLETLHLWRFDHPRLMEPLRTVADVAAALARDKHLIAGYDVEARFTAEAAAVEAGVHASLDEGHALVNGKWLVDVLAPRSLGRHATPQRCRDEWIAHAVATGGLAEARDLWQRITGRPA
jgi:hypothetical protein